nr:hypothetical protein [Tanacetum cinerariifolium]
MANEIPLDHVDDVPVVEPNQPDAIPFIPEPVLMDKDEDPQEEEFEEEEEPQEEKDIKPEDVIEIEDTVEPEDETVLVSVYKVGESSTATFLREDIDGLLPGLIRRDINSLFGRMTSLLRQLCDKGTAAMENLVRKLGNAEEKAECKKLKKELEEARFSNTFLHMENERVERDLYWTRVQAHEFYREMIRRGFMFEERPNEAIDVPVEDENSPSSEPRGSFRAVELRDGLRKKMTFGISECVEDKKVKFAAATLRGPAMTWWDSKVAILGLDIANQIGWTEMKKLMTTKFCPAEELQRMENELWNLKVKEYNMVAYTQRFNELDLMCPRMVEPESVKVDAYIRGLFDNIKGEATSPKATNLNEDVRMAHKLMEQKLQAWNERILKGNKRKWKNFQSGNNSGKSNNKDNSCQSSQSNQKQGNARAMTTAPSEGKVSSGSHPVKQEEVGEVCGRAYAIKDVEPQGLNVVTVNHLFEIDLMPIERVTFDVIIGIDWLIKHDAVIVCGKKVVRIPYENKMLTVESDKGVDLAKITKKWPKPNKIEHEIEKNAQKPDPMTFL